MIELNFDNVRVEGGYDIPWPSMYPVRQAFEAPVIAVKEIPGILAEQFQKTTISSKIRPGMKIAVGVGSRGISNLQEIVRCTVQELKERGAIPFIVPAMGSHGGGLAEGQQQILADYGITEEKVGAPIRASMDTVHLGKVNDEVDVYFDRIAYEEADGIIVVSRIKPHTDFKGRIESGFMKMLGIGLGKHKGASFLHRGGMLAFAQLVPDIGKFIMDKVPFLFGVGIIENAFHDTAHLEVVPKEELPKREEELLVNATEWMPKFHLQEIDVLIVDEIGKNISGSGMDPNIIGRSSSSEFFTFEQAPPIRRIVVLGITPESHGNSTGLGLADFTTVQTLSQIDFAAFYANTITAVEIGGGKLPLILKNDQQAIAAAIKTTRKRNLGEVRVVHIKNTLEMDKIWVSANLLDEVRQHPAMEVLGEGTTFHFDDTGMLVR